MFSQRQTQGNFHKMDILFYNAVKRAKNAYCKKIACHIGKAAYLLIVLIVDKTVFHSSNAPLQGLAYFGILVSLINAFINFIIKCANYRDSYSNNQIFLRLSKIAGHSAVQQRIVDMGNLNHLDRCVSLNLYNQVNGTQVNDPALTKQIKSKYEKINKNLVQTQVLQRRKCFPLADLVGRILCLIVVIYGIISLASSRPTLPQIIMYGLYIVVESINIWIVVVVFLAILFFPLICCVGCIYLCCYGTRAFVNRDALSIPEPTKANAQMIQEADGACTICFENFSLNDKVIVLPCSTKHMFHEKCIMSWFRVSNSCPICRAPLPNRI